MTDQFWRERAACNGDNPDNYDVEKSRIFNACEDYLAVVEWVEQGAICDGCPVARTCAADALRARDRGVIRAGIPLGFVESRTSAPWGMASDALQEVADGTSPRLARADMIVARIRAARNTSGNPYHGPDGPGPGVLRSALQRQRDAMLEDAAAEGIPA